MKGTKQKPYSNSSSSDQDSRPIVLIGRRSSRARRHRNNNNNNSSTNNSNYSSDNNSSSKTNRFPNGRPPLQRQGHILRHAFADALDDTSMMRFENVSMVFHEHDYSDSDIDKDGMDDLSLYEYSVAAPSYLEPLHPEQRANYLILGRLDSTHRRANQNISQYSFRHQGSIIISTTDDPLDDTYILTTNDDEEYCEPSNNSSRRDVLGSIIDLVDAERKTRIDRDPEKYRNNRLILGYLDADDKDDKKKQQQNDKKKKNLDSEKHDTDKSSTKKIEKTGRRVRHFLQCVIMRNSGNDETESTMDSDSQETQMYTTRRELTKTPSELRRGSF